MDETMDRYECVEPKLGEELWQLDDPELDERSRRELERHLAVCDACKLVRAVESSVEQGLRAATLSIPDDPRRSSEEGGFGWSLGIAWGGLATAAVGAFLLVTLPPRPLDGGAVLRSGSSATFERPVEGEVITALEPMIRWTEVEGASAYEISLREVGGDYSWRGTSEETSIAIPAEASLPMGAEIRVQLRPIPNDLAPAEGLGLMFRTGRWTDFASHRLRYGQPWALGVGALGLLLAVTGTLRRIF